VRQLKDWSQEDVANKLGMSLNGYGSIERGETDVNLSRLEQIAELFGIKLSDLLELNEKIVFSQTGTNNNQSNWHIGSCSPEYLQLKAELEKQQVINELKDKEIESLKEINGLLKKAGVMLASTGAILSLPPNLSGVINVRLQKACNPTLKTAILAVIMVQKICAILLIRSPA
jgi:transcriptional regulator with XRE-family HTH domain